MKFLPALAPRAAVSRETVLRAALAGIAAAALALGVAEVVAVLTGALSSPLLAVGAVVIDNVPGPVKDFGIAVFGTHDKTALITGTLLLLTLYAAAVGIAALRSWRTALAGIALFVIVGATAALTRHDAGPRGPAIPRRRPGRRIHPPPPPHPRRLALAASLFLSVLLAGHPRPAAIG